MKNILEWLEESARRYPEHSAYNDNDIDLSYSRLLMEVRSVGTYLAKQTGRRDPILILMPRGVGQLVCLHGATAAGCPYVVIDDEMPEERLAQIVKVTRPSAILAADQYRERAKGYPGVQDLSFTEALCYPADPGILQRIRDEMTDADLAYILFTSGSTGVPKGVAVSHRSVIAYIDWFTKTFGLDGHTVLGGQAPFYFSLCIADIYATLAASATLHVIAKPTFSFPAALIRELDKYRVNFIYWIPSALVLTADWKIFDYAVPSYLEQVLFCGEPMPARQLNEWIRHLPDVRFANLYGPTEAVDACTYYIIDRKFRDDEKIPIGRPCDNCAVLVIGKDGKAVSGSDLGELYIRGSFLAEGYYNDPGRTAISFVQNPLNPHYPERTYRTGDLVYRNERGELVFAGRADFQIKHLGYRIELGDIEAAASGIKEIANAAAIYDQEKKQIVLVYTGRELAPEELGELLGRKLPHYMIPGRYVHLKALPHNHNGKVDRNELAKRLAERTE